NRVGNANPGQARQVKCYNCNGTGDIARNCTRLKHPQNFEYYKDKMLLMQAQENGDLALNVDNVFQADDCDAFDSDVDEAPMAQTMFMANLSSADPYVKDNEVPVIHSNVSSIPNDAYMMIYNDMYEPHAQSVSNASQNTVVENSLTVELTTYKEQVELYERRAKFELTEREQKINEQLRLVFSDCNFNEETLKKELHSIKLQLASDMREFRTELGMPIRVKHDRLSATTATAQETGVALDAEQLLFLAGGQDNAFYDDVDEKPVQDLALNVDNVFQDDDCDVFDSDVDEAPTAQTMFMANLSSTDPVTDEAELSYDSDILSEVQDHDHYQDVVCAHHEEHAIHDSVQLNHVFDSRADYTSDSNMIPYDQYVKDNEVPIVHSDVSFVQMMLS
nr:retrovirus-related Pol polyprotein from transposon TNT 1-94 [Tanacetum cinerariifolium]